MIRASDLIGCEVQTGSGDRLGHVHDLRATRRDGSWYLTALVLGRRGASARLVGTDTDPLISGELVRWESVSRLTDGCVVLHDTRQHRGRAVHNQP
jgi:sporulation protein YlmC with PRC-barrel domain